MSVQQKGHQPEELNPKFAAVASNEVFDTHIQIRSQWWLFMHKEKCDPDLRLKTILSKLHALTCYYYEPFSVTNVRRTNAPRTGDSLSGLGLELVIAFQFFM